MLRDSFSEACYCYDNVTSSADRSLRASNRPDAKAIVKKTAIERETTARSQLTEYSRASCFQSPPSLRTATSAFDCLPTSSGLDGQLADTFNEFAGRMEPFDENLTRLRSRAGRKRKIGRPFDPIKAAKNASPRQLARLLAVNDVEEEAWEAADLGSILQHQLAASLRSELQEQLSDVKLVSFADLLFHGDPPVDVLRQACDYAESQCLLPGAVLPRPIALVLFYACLAAAKVHAHRQISSRKPSDLERGWRWACGLSWLQEELRQVFIEALDSLESESAPTSKH